MSITDELREWAVNHRAELDMGQLYPAMIHDIADRIDAEHERLMQEQPYTIDMVPMTDESMAEHGWARLPKDADDVPWSVGDRDEDGNTVTQLRLSSDGWYAVTDGPSAFHPEQRRHYHAHTVEDVLREFTDAILEWSGKSGTVAEVGTWSDVAAEYAAKLRLAEGEDA